METWLCTHCLSVLGLPDITVSAAAPRDPLKWDYWGQVGLVILTATHPKINSSLLAPKFSELPNSFPLKHFASRSLSFVQVLDSRGILALQSQCADCVLAQIEFCQLCWETGACMRGEPALESAPCTSTELPRWWDVLPACSGVGISAEMCVVEENSKGGTVFDEVEMVQLWFSFGMTFLSKMHLIFCKQVTQCFLKSWFGIKFFSILKMFLFIWNIFSERLCSKCQNVLISYGKQKNLPLDKL